MRKILLVSYWFKLALPALCIIIGAINGSPAALAKSKSNSPDIGEDPGPVYTDVVLKWATTTNFAQNAAQMIVGKFKLEIENDPKLSKAFTPALKSDLEQFFYELFISSETIKDLAKVYAQYFTLDDMEDMIKFYQSPVGQKLIKAEPQLQLKTQQIGEILLKEHKNDYMRIIGKHIAGESKK